MQLGLVALVALGSAGCPSDSGSEGEGETGGECDRLPGDLVITEIMADPEGSDEGREWFEIYNATGSAIDLQGLTLVYTKADGSGRAEHVVARSLEIPPGGYVVVAGMLDEIAAGTEWADYGWGNGLASFVNGGGYLAVECEGDIIDEVYYDAATSGVSRSHGLIVPDAVANDNLDTWCDSRSEYEPDFVATPRAANDVCGGSGTCLADGQEVDVVPAGAGDLVITEVHANPGLIADEDGEWFEIYSLAADTIHLNDLELGRDPEDGAEETIASADCIPLAPGEYAVIAANADPTVNGGVPEETIVWQTGISLTNSEGSLWLGLGGEVFDLVTWTGATESTAWQLDPDLFDPSQNDDPVSWCDAETPYPDPNAMGESELGTPGGENIQCMGTAPEGQCYEDGELRAIVPPDMGDIVITELLSNATSDDGDKEWFELQFQGSGDLNGLEIRKEEAGDVQDTIGSPTDACIPISAGTYLLFAQHDDPLVNGGLPPVDYVYDMTLNNSNGGLFVGYGGEIWDGVTWASRDEGASRSLDPLATTVTDNDDPANWCSGVDLYGDTDLGTPGGQNPACGGGGGNTCVDPDTDMMRMIDAPTADELTITEVMPNPSTAEPGGEWFELHAGAPFDLNGLQLGKGGAVSHTVVAAECIEIPADSYLVFARSEVDAENCTLPQVDHVYDSLSLNNSDGNLQVGFGDVVLVETSWASTQNGTALSYDAMAMTWCDAVDPFGCGDLGTPGALNPACGGGGMEGQCFDGNMWRDIVAPAPGDLVISEFMANPAAVADSAGEWFELRALGSFDLNGLELGRAFVDGTLDTVDLPDCVPLTPGDTALLANNDDPLQNGGLPAVDFVIGFGLTNSNSALHVASGGVLLDEITWSSVSAGASTSLDPDNTDPNLNDVADNDGVIWCYATAPYGDGDNGSPKADNEQCN